jgi:CheY-like chemotaxis protein
MHSNVLLIDDGAIDNYIFETLLKQTGKEISTTICTNGKIAIDKLEKIKKDNSAVLPEYIIVDITMPTMDGWEFLNEYQTSSIFKTDYNRSQGYPFINGFIVKPIDSQALNKILC